MRAYSNMSNYDFIEQIRDAAIRNNAGPIVVGLIDELLACPDSDEHDAKCEESWQQGYSKADDENKELIAELEAKIEKLEKDLEAALGDDLND